MSKPISICCYPDADALAAAFTERLKTELAAHPDHPANPGATPDAPVGIMLSGGSTPLVVYKAITKAPVAASEIGAGVRLFMSDERHVPRDDEGNNFNNTRPMFAALGLNDDQLLPVRTELDTAEAAAEDYAATMNTFFESGGTIPLGMLGMGSDGHTASLFSAAQIDAADASDAFAVAVDRPDGRRGISLTPKVFERIDTIVLLVAGSGKQEQVKNLLDRPETIPAGIIASRCKSVELWCDEAALGTWVPFAPAPD